MDDKSPYIIGAAVMVITSLFAVANVAIRKAWRDLEYGHDHLSKRCDQLNNDINSVKLEISQLITRTEMNALLDKQSGKIDKLESRFDDGLKGVHKRLDDLLNRPKNQRSGDKN